MRIDTEATLKKAGQWFARPLLACSILCFCLPSLYSFASSLKSPEALRREVEKLSTKRLEERRDELKRQVAESSKFGLHLGASMLGHRSESTQDPNHKEWLQVNFERTRSIDEIVIVPIVRLDSNQQIRTRMFPHQIRVVAGLKNNPESHRLLFQSEDGMRINEQSAPLFVEADGMEADWVRLEVDQLFQEWRSIATGVETHSFALSELLVFSGSENVALNRSVTYSSAVIQELNWDPTAAVDGFTPYRIQDATGKQQYRKTHPKSSDENLVQIDLGVKRVITSAHLHPYIVQNSFPRSQPDGYGFPVRFKIEGANQSDFSDVVTLVDQSDSDFRNPSGIPVRFRVNDIPARYVRLNVKKLYYSSSNQKHGFGLDEIEIYSGQENVAFKRPLKVSRHRNDNYDPNTLVDGMSRKGPVTSQRDLFVTIAKRAEDLATLNVIEPILSLRYARAKQLWRISAWALGGLGILFVLILFFLNVRRMRELLETRQQIANDLHDELGGNLSSIALLGDIALGDDQEEGERKRLLNEIVALANTTRKVSEKFVWMLEQPNTQDSLVSQLQKTADRLLADHRHRFVIKGEEYLSKLAPFKASQLILFYKETLHNILKHAKATHIYTEIIATREELSLVVDDDGIGITTDAASLPLPRSLRRRARRLRGRVSIRNRESHGTRVHLSCHLG